MKTYYPLLDAVRFFAAFWVMNFHYLLGLGLSNDLHWYRYGNLGVQLFFIISGFVIVQSLQNKSFKEFTSGRFLRLFPLFWICCTATYLLTLLVPGANNLEAFEYARSMTMVGDMFNEFFTFGRLIDPSYWTLAVELLFYAGIAIFTVLFSFKKIRYFLASWLLLSTLAFVFNVNQDFYVKLALVSHASYFIFGGTLALICSKQAKNIYEKYFDITLLFASAFFATYIHPKALPQYITQNLHDEKIVTILHIIFFISVLFLVYVSPLIKNTRSIKLFIILGGMTYPLYLLHQTIGNTLINYATDILMISRNTFIVFFEIFILLIAYIAYIQDKKMRTWLQGKLR